eukprot:1410145-Lingulodinium_polyedra.AAC.1
MLQGVARKLLERWFSCCFLGAARVALGFCCLGALRWCLSVAWVVPGRFGTALGAVGAFGFCCLGGAWV